MKLRKKWIFPHLKQRDMTECGTTCLAMIFKYYGLYNIQSTLRELAHVSAAGTDLYTLSEVAQMFGFESDGYETGYDSLLQVKQPCICHYEGNHFVVIYKADEKQVWIADPAFGKMTLLKDEFVKKWNGVLLTVTPTDLVFKNKDVMDLIEKRRAELREVRKNFYTALLHPYRGVLLEIALGTFVIQILALLLPFFTRTIVDQVIVYQDKPLLFAVLIALLVTFAVRTLIFHARNVMILQFKTEFELDFFSRFFDHFIHLNQKYFDGYKREDFIHRFQENMKVRHLLRPGILDTFIDVPFLLVYIAVLFWISPLLAAFVGFFVACFLALTIIFSPRLHHLEERSFYEGVKTMGSFLDTLLGVQTVKLLGIETLKFWDWKSKYRRALNKVLETHSLYLMLQSILEGLFNLSRIGTYWIGAYLAMNGTITLGDYVAFITIFMLILQPIQRMAMLWFMILELGVTYDKLNDILVQPRETADLSLQRTDDIGGDVELRDVRFRYRDNEEQWILDGLTATIPAGSSVAIVGRNGSGKTTFAKLMVKLYDHYQGQILLGGVELRAIHPRALRKKVVMVPQDIFIFSTTIKENILYAREEAGIDEIIQATKYARFDEFVHDNYLGYNYMVGESGANLSGGQRLRLAFARLFLAQPDVIILDEATSVLDVESEKLILENVRKAFPRQTIISIAHRLSTVKSADLILVFDRGKVVEQGKHADLLAQKGLYYDFMKTYLDF